MTLKPLPGTLIRFRSNGHEAKVTRHTDRGFKYELVRDYPFIPRWGMYFSGEGEVFTDVLGYDWQRDIKLIQELSGPDDPIVREPLPYVVETDSHEQA